MKCQYRDLACALIRATLCEFYAFPKIVAKGGFWYFVKHVLCTLYLTSKTLKPPKFPRPDCTKQSFTALEVGLYRSETEWNQERPKDKDHLLSQKEDIHIFHGTHIESGSHLTIRLSRLQEGLCQAFIILQVNDGSVYHLQNEVQLDLSDNLSYHGCGLKLECLSPMRSWRIAYNGLLKDKDENEVHVKFGGIWTAGSHVFEYPHEVSRKTMADVFAKLNLFTMIAQVESIYNEEFAYSQSGHMALQVVVDGQDAEDIYLWGTRMHYAGKLEPRSETHRYLYFRDGHKIHLITRSIENETVTMGTVYNPSTLKKPAQVLEISDSGILLKTDEKKYCVRNTSTVIKEMKLETTHPQIKDRFVFTKDDVIMNEHKGTMVTIVVVRKNRPVMGLPEEYRHQQVDCSKSVSSLALLTSDEDCKRSDLTGGKGSSLAVLTSVAAQSRQFTVPRAIVLTTNAYEVFANEPAVRAAVLDLLAVSRTNPDSEVLKKACEKCVSEIEKAKLPKNILKDLVNKLSSFGESEKLRFAVRSSAVGEDSEEMSAAGQMTTFLGVLGSNIDDIAASIVKCWASQFSFTAVNYKRQYGQVIDSKMAVVVQEMVSADAAGVMFTCHPVTSNPQYITITANYGLGESVVAAAADPDAFLLKRDGKDVKIESFVLGKKATIIEEDGNGGTIEKELDEESAKKGCISDEQAKALAHIGIKIESCYTTARDIEWAIKNDKYYLLQSRPVTSITKETDFEIINDQNTMIKSEGEIMSKATIAEILPGAVAPLGQVVIDTLFDRLSRKAMAGFRGGDFETSFFVNLIMATFRKQHFIIMSDRDPNNSMENSYASFGKDISKEEAFIKGVVRLPEKKGGIVSKIKGAIMLPIRMLFSPDVVGMSHKFSLSFKIFTNKHISASQQLQHIMASTVKVGICSMGLIMGFVKTSLFDLFVMKVLSWANNGEVTPEILTITASLLQAGEIESVDVPLSLQRLGAGLSKSPHKDEFIKMTPEEAHKWLSETDAIDGVKFRDFIAKHGHRCVKEFDIYVEPWSMKPVNLVKTLQTAAKVPHDPKPPANLDYDLDSVGLPLTAVHKILLRFLIPRARHAVAQREVAKSAIIRVVHKIRLAVHVLAKQMVNEGRIPSADLIFFMSFDEINQLIDTRNPSIVARAIRRRRLHTVVDNERYPVLQYGIPQQVKPVDKALSLMELKGTPVCQGMIEGKARVIKHFDTEAHLIEKGEILITTATDTGWTPYFPILGGVVTEVGGLVSHGAVVAREYGLPCVVGIENATQMFDSGDIIRLDGGKGTIQKIQRESNE